MNGELAADLLLVIPRGNKVTRERRTVDGLAVEKRVEIGVHCQHLDDVGSGSQGYDPPIRFNETRDTAIIKDASKYQFSIIRFVMDGANKDLPLFIPAIQSGTGQTDVNLTEYGFGMTWEGIVGGVTYNITVPVQYVSYVPETQSAVLAPLPRPVSSQNYIGIWSSTVTYGDKDIVYYNPDQLYYQFNALPATPTSLNQPPPSFPNLWRVVSPELGRPQDLSSRYYWVYTYSHWVDLINTTLVAINTALYNALFAQLPAPQQVAPFDTYANFATEFPAPIMAYDIGSGLFSIYYPDGYLNPITPSVGTATDVFQTLYFNVNMEGLFANFDNVYLNQPSHPANANGFRYTWINPTTPLATLYPDGYANLQRVAVVGLNDNIRPAVTPNPPQGYARTWVKMTQNYTSTSTLWSPIDSIVFTSTLLPLQNEQTAPPNSLGSRNTGNSTATSQSAFAPIITDVALDLSSDPSGYRKMIYYAPQAEYRMADFQNSKADIRNVDIQVFWKNRLDNSLYPISMFNLSSVSFKLMFRKKTTPPKSDY